MEYSVSQDGATKIIALKGRFTFTDNDTFRSVVASIEENKSNPCVLDLRDLEFLDSAGLGMFFLARDTAEENQVRISIRNAQGEVKRLLDVSRFNEIIPIEG